ncbi:hypothetical protein CVT26_015908 [Gymnopilus dilepis]|uniref:Small ribosomal subunit protein mS29 n=1 Tax=Gymnopilus dilepis TaxID=231916 RepID=A0A409WAE4_9AGAR|nr:hypothetical protein CVT26_015908 [Gymnopilus dilepis]
MSLLSAASRAGPSVQRTVLPGLVPFYASIETPRYKADKVVKKAQPTAPVISGRWVRKGEEKSRQRKRLPPFKPLPMSRKIEDFFDEKTMANFEVSTLTPHALRDPESVGQILQITPPENDPLRIFGLPRKLHSEYQILTKPYTVVREITKQTVDFLQKARRQPSSGSRVVLTGRAGTGKSVLMLQAVEHCVQDGWVVVYIPRGIRLVDSTTSYIYDLRSQTYLQPAYSFQILQRMLTVNREPLASLQLADDLVLEKQTISKGTTLERVIEYTISDKARALPQAAAILDAVMRSLDAQKRFPVLLAVDEFQALYHKTTYRDPHFQRIQPYHLSIPRLIMEYASGKRSFSRGAVIGALSLSQTSFTLPLELRDALDLEDLDAYPISPFAKRNKEMFAYTEGLQKMAVPEKLTLAEAAGVFEVWKGTKVVGRENYFFDEAFLGKYTESGGNARDFVWKGILGSLDM